MRPVRFFPFFCLTMAGELALVVLVGCSAQPKSAARPAVVDVHRKTSGTADASALDGANRSEPRIVHVGEVRVVDEEKRFVLIDLQSNLYLPEPGVVLRSIRDTRETAKLKVSPERMRPFIAADIIEGEPAPNDQVVK